MAPIVGTDGLPRGPGAHGELQMVAQQPRHAFEGLAEVARLVERFENVSLPQAEWNHRAHLTVALWYVVNYDEHDATARMIDHIRSYNRAQGIRQTRTTGYHETITLFWLAITRRFFETRWPDESMPDLFETFLQRYAGRVTLIFEHYSKERLFSLKARQSWVEPDLRPLFRR